ncbi:unnamed protein product [Knipowitschia caucasica]
MKSGATVNSFPGSSPEPSKGALHNYQADHAIPYHNIGSTPTTPTTDKSHLSPSIAPSFPNTLHLLAASTHFSSPIYEPTESPPDYIFPSDTLDVDWGSGDYLETISYLGSDGSDYSLVTKVPTEMFDMDEDTEIYDTSFPTRVGVSLTSMQHFPHSPSLTTAHFASSHFTIKPTPSITLHTEVAESADLDWSDHFTIEPTDVLLPDMNSLEYYTTQQESSNNGAEQRGNVTVVAVTEITATISFDNFTKDESSSDLSGVEPSFETPMTPINVSHDVLEPSKASSHLSSTWTSEILESTSQLGERNNNATMSLADDVTAYSSLTDVHWFVTEPYPETTMHFTTTVAFSSHPTNTDASNFATPTPIEKWTISNGTTDVVTPDTPVTWWDQGSTEDGDDIPATVTLLSESTEADTTTTTASTTVTTTPHQGTPKLTTGTEMSSDGSVSHTIKPPATTQPATTQPATTQPATTQPATTQPATTQPATTQPATTQPATTQPATTQPATTQPAKQYLCDVNKPEYLVKIGFPFGATIGYAKSQIRDILKGEFNKSVEIQHVTAPPKFVFRVVSGPVVYTAISVINTLQRSGRRFLSISPSWTLPDYKYQVHTVLQFVPSHIDIRFCNFTENIERGLSRAYAETQRRSKMSPNFTVHIVNITHSPLKSQGQLARQPVDIVFTVRGSRGHVTGSEVSDALLKLTMVEFSYYMGFPVLQIAEPFHYPELNTSQLLRSSWVKTVLLGVMDQKVNEKTFQANVERRVAMLLGEAMGVIRRVKRATTVGNSSVQV